MITRKKLNIYDKIFKHFISKDKGCILAITSDQLFSKVIRGAFRSAGLPTNSLFNCSQLDKAISQGKSLLVRFTQVIFLVDTTMEGKTGVIHLKSIKELMGSSCRIVVATNEVGRERIIQMYEMGADNVIIKPISVDSLIQKIAHTINPNKKIGRLVDECRAMIALDELDKAEETVQAIISIKADSPIAYILKGDIAKKKKEFDTAEQNYLQASRFNGHYLDPLKKLAELYSDTNRLEKKLELLKKLDVISPLNPERKIDIAQTYLEAGNEEMAIQNFNLAVEQVKKQVGEMICGTLMKIARKAQGVRPDISSKYISMAIEQKGKLLSREDLWMIAEMGVALRQQGKWQEAISYYKRGLEVAPLSGYLYYNIGVAYLQGKEFYKALSSFQKTIEYSPEILKKQAVIPCNIAKAYIGLGRKKEAAKFLNMALKQDPDHKETKRILLTVWKKKISASRQPHQS